MKLAGRRASGVRRLYRCLMSAALPIDARPLHLLLARPCPQCLFGTRYATEEADDAPALSPLCPPPLDEDGGHDEDDDEGRHRRSLDELYDEVLGTPQALYYAPRPPASSRSGSRTHVSIADLVRREFRLRRPRTDDVRSHLPIEFIQSPMIFIYERRRNNQIC